MIDLHSHILPRMDDGSRSTEESLQMLTALGAQGVTDVAATPHFYASENGPDRFLARRARSWQQLRPHLTASLPRVHLGAEVLFFEGIAAFDGLPRLCLSGTDVLLLEMPFRPWNGRMLDELLELAGRPDVTVLLAHMERYLPYVAEPDWRPVYPIQRRFFLRVFHPPKGSAPAVGGPDTRAGHGLPQYGAARAPHGQSGARHRQSPWR